ncbi:MAG TPA: hypothetical protein EYM84_09250 [Flavobacteriales bacterium]|jgi:hypothetical protein|nr:hypothetical protein [Flavobacteriales bacterium]
MSLPVDIDSLKSTIGKHGGLARSNRFACYMPYPGGPGLLNLDFGSLLTNFLSPGGFDTAALFNDPRDMFILCESVQIPGRRIATMEQFHTHFSVKKPYSHIVDEVTLTFLLTNDYHIRKYFDKWQDKIVGHESSPRIGYREEYATDVTIQQLSGSEGSSGWLPGYQVKLKNAFPIAVSAVELSNSSENAVLQCSITLSYDDWVDVGIGEGIGDLLKVGSTLLRNTIGGSIGSLFG